MIIFQDCILINLILGNVIKVIQAPSQYEICRITRRGTEYEGKISETRSGHICEYWESVSMSYNEATKNITDNHFPDGNRRAARNFCRNPNNSPFGPWCFTKIESQEKDNCTVPMCCNNENCKSTGPGMEYSGRLHKSIYDNECVHWAAAAKMVNIDNMLPEGNSMLAGQSCRNPTGDLGGPWCYVLSGETSGDLDNEEVWAKEPCDVPTCFNQQFITVIYQDLIGNDVDNYFTHFSSLADKKDDISFSTKLWNPEDWSNGEIKIAVSSLASLATGNQLRNWDIGYEVILRNVNGGVTPNAYEDKNWEDRPGLVSGTHWVHLRLSWSNGFISLRAQDKEKPYFIHEYKKEVGGILSQGKAQIKYISMMGTMAFWNFTQDENFCEEHITITTKISRYWPLSSESLNRFIGFHLRSNGQCVIEFRMTPPQEFPRVQLRIEDDSGRTIILLYKSDNSKQILSSALLDSPLSYWRWNEFSISISGHRFNVLMNTKKGLETVFDVQNQIFQAIKWYGIASASTSHWTLFCKPLQEEYEPMPPDCTASKMDMEYEGHQWITQSGLPCLPWVANLITGLENNQFPDGSIAAALNYCRNPTADSQGAFCFAVNISEEVKVSKESCNLRKCKFKDCRIAGTANDFMGEVSTTISGRQCQSWESNNPHFVEKYLLNDELFPERSVKKAGNYCRDPSNSMGGPWCFTLDPEIEKDLCNIPDCYKPTACTVIVRTATNKKVFIVPLWRAHGLPMWIKMWNPNVSTTLVLNFYPPDKEYKYQLLLGDDENESIKLYYISESGSETLLKQKTSQHFLSSGRWIGIIIILMNNEMNILYEEKLEPFFIWKRGTYDIFPDINVMFFSYEAKSKDNEGSLGLNFPCDICQTEICYKEFSHFSEYYPMNLWMETNSLLVKNISFHVRGRGAFTVNFYSLPSKFPIGVLNIDDGSFGDLMEIQLVRRKYLYRFAAKNKGSSAIVNDYWSEITLTIADKNGSLILNGTTFMTWTYPREPLFYYFSVQCNDKVTWVVNCLPPILDGIPINGGWSPWSAWQCSSTCGGGRGTRKRICNQPEPSMFGKICEGPSSEIGICNENACGEISMIAINLIRKHLAQQASNIQVYVGDPVEMQCNANLLELIRKDSPKSSIHWNQNGMKISKDLQIEALFPENVKLVIRAANISDSGVYACIATKPGKENEIVDIFALTIKSKDFTITSRIGQKVVLKANSILLNLVYNYLRLTWFLNGNVYKEYDVTDLSLIEEEIIDPVIWEHMGEWSCIVYQEQLLLNWTTSLYSMKVKRRTNWATYLLEEDLLKGKLGSNETVVYVAMAVIFIIVLAATIAVTISMIRLIRYFNKMQGK